MMTAIENLHYALGELAYAVASVEGKIQEKERKKFHKIVMNEIRFRKDYSFDVSDIIFRVLDKERQPDTEVIYNSAMYTLKMNSHYLSPQLKKTFIKVIQKTARAFPHISHSEQNLLERFKTDMAAINVDQVYNQAS
jgi:uncharacterized tellurite resistance protein B-like protein